jgi:hypothetical protein
MLDGGDEFDAIVKLNRLGKVVVGASAITTADIFVAVRGGEDDDGNFAEGFVGFDLFKDFKSVVAREVQVEEDDVGAWRVEAVKIAVALKYVIEGFFPVAANGDARAAAAAAERLERDFNIGGVVFDEEDVVESAQGLGSFR